MSRLRLVLAAAAAVLTSLAVSACGGDDFDPGPAAVVPADAAVYADGVVKLDDEDRDALQSSLGTLLGEPDVEARIDEALDELLEGEDVSWTEDIEPWAGERAGIFFLDFEFEDGALILATEDEEAATESLEGLIASEGAPRDASHQGVAYRVSDPEDAAGGVIEGFAVMGSESGVQAAIDASQDESLGDSDDFEVATEDLSDDRLATVYAAPEATLEALVEAGEIDAAKRAEIAEELGAASEEPLAVSLGATTDTLFAEAESRGDDDSVAPSASDLIERAPEGAWLAFALGGVGTALEAAFAAADEGSLETGIGLDLPALAAATGDAGGYFAGTSFLGITGAALLEEREEGSLAAPLAGLERGLAGDPAVRVEPLDLDGEGFTLLPAEAPIQFPFVLRDGLLVAAVGTDGVAQAFDPESSVVDSEPFQAAADSLGDDFAVVAYLELDPMLQLLGSIPGFWDDPEMAAARPYLERLERFVAGARTDDGRSMIRMVLDVREGGDEE